MSVSTMVRVAAVMAAAMALGGCPWMRSAETPMPAVYHAGHGPDSADGLVVFMPGFGDGPDHFADNGFVKQIKGVGRSWDVVAPDAHFGYYREFSVLERLRQDVIAPAREKGYKQIWLVGISMGGFGALSYAQRYPGDVQGVVALAPYMGEDEVVDAVIKAGGLPKWTPPANIDAMEDKRLQQSYRLWRWFKQYEGGQGDKPAIVVGWGEKDRLGRPTSQLAALLPKERVFVRKDGVHKWTTWRPLFARVAPAVFGTQGLAPPAAALSAEVKK